MVRRSTIVATDRARRLSQAHAFPRVCGRGRAHGGSGRGRCPGLGPRSTPDRGVARRRRRGGRRHRDLQGAAGVRQRRHQGRRGAPRDRSALRRRGHRAAHPRARPLVRGRADGGRAGREALPGAHRQGPVGAQGPGALVLAVGRQAAAAGVPGDAGRHQHRRVHADRADPLRARQGVPVVPAARRRRGAQPGGAGVHDPPGLGQRNNRDRNRRRPEGARRAQSCSRARPSRRGSPRSATPAAPATCRAWSRSRTRPPHGARSPRRR